MPLLTTAALVLRRADYGDYDRMVTLLTPGHGRLDAVARGCDTLVTADVKYDQFLFAREEGINLIDADHFCTENVVVPVLADMLGEAFPELDVHISKRHCQTACFF